MPRLLLPFGLISFLLLWLPRPTLAQQHLEFAPRFSQTSDELNNHMVFAGPELLLRYRARSVTETSLTQLSSGLGAGVLFNRGILGLSARLDATEFLYALPVLRGSSFRTYAGAKGLLAYHLQLYPDLQSGHDFWLTQLSLSPALVIEGRAGMRLAASATVLSAVSRTPRDRNPHAFSLALGDILGDMHSDFRLAGPSRLMHLALSAEYPLAASGDWALRYSLDYWSYDGDADLEMLSHGLALTAIIRGN